MVSLNFHSNGCRPPEETFFLCLTKASLSALHLVLQVSAEERSKSDQSRDDNVFFVKGDKAVSCSGTVAVVKRKTATLIATPQAHSD